MSNSIKVALAISIPIAFALMIMAGEYKSAQDSKMEAAVATACINSGGKYAWSWGHPTCEHQR